jgi:hypothetical protein
MNTFNLQSVDHLIEGVHYTVVDWSFAEGHARDRGLETNMPSRGTASTFAEECEQDERMIFGKCRKTKKDGDWDSSKKTKGEQAGEAQAAKEGSNFQNNKMVNDVNSGKKLGWAMKGGKPVLVEWGSVAGEKKVGPAKPQAKGTSRSGATDSTRAGQLAGNDRAASKQANDAGRLAQEENKRNILTQTRSPG